jgi:4-amino-4-deoxy-L-arabinose transferase-like glycosyltransferase
LVGRALNVGFFLGSLILLFKLVRLLSSRRDAVVAAAAFAAAPIVWMSTLSARPHMAAAFWSTLMLYCVVRFVSEEKFRYFVLAAIALGLAAGSSLPAAIVGLAFPLLLYGAKPLRFAIGYSATAALAALVVFVLTNPYAVLNFGEFFDNISFHADSDRYQRVAFDVGKAVAFFIDVVYDFSFPMSLVGLLAIAWFVVDPPSKLGRRIALLAGAVLVLVGSTIATTRILIFIVPIVAVVAALAIGRLLSVAKAPAVRAALVVPLMVPSSITALVFSVDSLAEAQDHERFLQWSEKARKHPEQAVGLLSSPTPHYFPPFPFFHREVVDLSRVASDTSRLPRFAVVSEPDEPLWETYPSRKYYRQVLVSQRPLWPEWLRISGIDPRRDHRRPKRVSVFEATSVR